MGKIQILKINFTFNSVTWVWVSGLCRQCVLCACICVCATITCHIRYVNENIIDVLCVAHAIGCVLHMHDMYR